MKKCEKEWSSFKTAIPGKLKTSNKMHLIMGEHECQVDHQVPAPKEHHVEGCRLVGNMKATDYDALAQYRKVTR